MERDEIERELDCLDRKQLCQIAWLCGVRVLPFLSTQRDFAYWSKNDIQRHLCSIFCALDACAQLAFLNYDNESAILDAQYATCDTDEAATATNYIFARNIAKIIAGTTSAIAKTPIDVSEIADALEISYTKILKLKTLLFEDVKAIKENRLNECNHDTNKYCDIWNDFQEDLKAIGCEYWARLYENLFKRGFDKMDKKELERRLFYTSEEFRKQGAAEFGRYLESLSDNADELLNPAEEDKPLMASVIPMDKTEKGNSVYNININTNITNNGDGNINQSSDSMASVSKDKFNLPDKVTEEQFNQILNKLKEYLKSEDGEKLNYNDVKILEASISEALKLGYEKGWDILHKLSSIASIGSVISMCLCLS